jgi:hypothetical protein
MDNEKQFTWADFKKAVNKMPENQLNKSVIIWTADEQCYHVTHVQVLKEDYVHDGDEGCTPRSILKEEWKEAKEYDTHYVIHEKGTRIINAE